MEALEVGVGAIGGVAQPIVGEAHHLVRRLDLAAGQSNLQRRIMTGLIFIKIAPDMRYEIDVVPRRGMGISVEPAEGQIRAGKEREGESSEEQQKELHSLRHRTYDIYR